MEMLYNPSQMDKKELYNTFVAREELLHELLETIKDNTDTKSIQHIILLGARGIGKTHMLRIIENKVSDLHDLQSKWVTVNVPEEQYGVFGLIDFFEYLLKIIFHSSQLEKVDKNTYRKELLEIEQNKNKESLDKIVSIFKDISQKENKQFLLLIDNIDKILAEKITEEKEIEYLRSILMTENFLMIIGTSTSIFEEIALYDKAFFRFFKIIHLQNLNDKEVETLLIKRAKFDGIADKIKLDENKNKIKAITDLTGGYPRLVLMLYEILEDKPLLDVLKTFNKLLDNLTPYYKHRMDDLAPQQQKIIDTIMLSDGQASPTDVAKKTGWKPTTITSQFKRLKDLNILRIKESGEAKKRKAVYEISDRLFVIWYQMRYLGVIRRRIEYIVTFLKIWYDIEELNDKISVYSSQYQQNYSMGNFSESYSYVSSISIMSYAMNELNEREKIIYEQVRRYIDIGKFEDALTDLKDLLKIHEERGNRQGIAIDFGNMGIVFQAQGDLKKSLQNHEKALEIVKEIGDKRGEGKALVNLGNAHSALGQVQKAIEFYEKGMKIAQEINDKYDEGTVLRNLGKAYHYLGRTGKAIEYNEKAMVIAHKIGNKHEQGVLIGDMGDEYRVQGFIDKSIECYENALEIAQSIGDKISESVHHGNLGIDYRIQGDNEKAIKFLEKAVTIAHEIKDRRYESRWLTNLGIVHRDLGEWTKAIEYYRNALEIAKDIEDKRNEGFLNGEIGTVYRCQNEIEKALEYYGKALKIAQDIEDKSNLSKWLGNLGTTYKNVGNFMKAIEYYENSIIIAHEIGHLRFEGRWLGKLGNAYSDLGQVQKAIEFYEKALKIYKEIGEKLNYNITNNNKIILLFKFAITHNKEKNAGMALENLEEIVESLKETKNEDTIKIIVSTIFELLKDSEYDFAVTIMEMLQKEHKDIFEICEPFMISAKYLKTKDPGILEDTSSIILEGVKKILEAVERPKNEMNE